MYQSGNERACLNTVGVGGNEAVSLTAGHTGPRLRFWSWAGSTLNPGSVSRCMPSSELHPLSFLINKSGIIILLLGLSAITQLTCLVHKFMLKMVDKLVLGKRVISQHFNSEVSKDVD